MSTVRAVVYERYGDPVQVLKLGSLPAPAEPGAGEVLVRVVVRPVHPGDLTGVVGPGRGTPVGPQTPGLEGQGIVESVGAGVPDLRPGVRGVLSGAGGVERMRGRARSSLRAAAGFGL